MKTIEYLNNHGLDALCTAFAIKAKRHGRYPNLVMLKYSQTESPMGERIVQECRGLILDEADGWRVVSRPFDKFFNHGEGHAAAIDWTTARVYEKLDGSLMTLYWHDGQWQVASNGTPDGGGPVPACGGTFADLFWRTFRAKAYRLPAAPETADDRPCCYMFELMTLHNRVVVRHNDARLVLIGCRCLSEHREYPPEAIDAHGLGWEVVRSFPLTCIDECLSAAKAINPMEGEGYVVRDEAFNRVKVKSPQYVALAHMKEGMSGRRLLEIVRANESEEFLAYFPEFADAYRTVRVAFDSLCERMEWEYDRLRGIPEQKAFALEAVKTPCSSALFSLRAGKCKTVREFMSQATSQAVERSLGIDLTAMVVGESVEVG